MYLTSQDGDLIRLQIKARSQSVGQFARANHIDKGYLSKILNGHAAISGKKFNLVFGGLGLRMIHPDPHIVQDSTSVETI